MKRKQESRTSSVFSVVITLLVIFIYNTYSQPQNYFKGNSVSEFLVRNSKNKITQLPSKALPRIGRRNGGGPIVHLGENEGYENSNMRENYGDDGQLGYYAPSPDYKNQHENGKPNLVLVLKRYLKDSVFRTTTGTDEQYPY